MRLRTFPFYLSMPAGTNRRSSIATPVMTGGVIVLDYSIITGERVDPPRSAIEIGYIVGAQINELNVPTTQQRTYIPLTEMVSGGDPASPWPPELNGLPLGGGNPTVFGSRVPLLIPIDEAQVSVVVALASMRVIGGAFQVSGMVRCVENVPKAVLECPHMWAIQ